MWMNLHGRVLKKKKTLLLELKMLLSMWKVCIMFNFRYKRISY